MGVLEQEQENLSAVPERLRAQKKHAQLGLHRHGRFHNSGVLICGSQIIGLLLEGPPQSIEKATWALCKLHMVAGANID